MGEKEREGFQTEFNNAPKSMLQLALLLAPYMYHTNEI